MKRYKCEDIPEMPILEFLRDNPRATWFYDDIAVFPNSVNNVMPDFAKNTKLVLAKMKMLVRRGLVSGCACGCRGDFELTQKGKEYLTELSQCVMIKGRGY